MLKATLMRRDVIFVLVLLLVVGRIACVAACGFQAVDPIQPHCHQHHGGSPKVDCNSCPEAAPVQTAVAPPLHMVLATAAVVHVVDSIPLWHPILACDASPPSFPDDLFLVLRI